MWADVFSDDRHILEQVPYCNQSLTFSSICVSVISNELYWMFIQIKC